MTTAAPLGNVYMPLQAFYDVDNISLAQFETWCDTFGGTKFISTTNREIGYCQSNSLTDDKPFYVGFEQDITQVTAFTCGIVAQVQGVAERLDIGLR